MLTDRHPVLVESSRPTWRAKMQSLELPADTPSRFVTPSFSNPNIRLELMVIISSVIQPSWSGSHKYSTKLSISDSRENILHKRVVGVSRFFIEFFHLVHPMLFARIDINLLTQYLPGHCHPILQGIGWRSYDKRPGERTAFGGYNVHWY